MSSTIDATDFLRSIPPFDALSAAPFEEAARDLEVRFHPAGTRLVAAGGEPLHHLYVIRKGAVRLERNGRTLQVLEEGEVFGYTSLLKKEATLDVVVEEDLVAYLLPERAFEGLLSDARFAGHFAARVAERLRASMARPTGAPHRPDLEVAVQEIAPRRPVWIDADASVGDVARLMRSERVTSLLVRTEPPGIVTDRDLRGRVLAEGRGSATPVSDVCTRPLTTAPAETPVHAAWATLLDSGVHHLPLTRGAEIVGMVTSTDFLRHTAPGPIAVLRGIERLSSRAHLAGYAERVADMSAALLGSGLDALVIAGFVARLNDALLRRILEWAEADLGAPPAPYAWLALGSEGRMEQTLLTDQDNAVVFDAAGASRREWFQSLAERANADLEAAGFPPCPGGYMARQWNAPLPEWTERFRGWTEVPNPEALLAAAIFFDFRRVWGALELGSLDAVLAGARRKTAFLRLLATASLAHHPPPGFLLRLRGESAVVDLKAHAVQPIVLLARCVALEAGSRARSTVERLDAATRAGLVEEAERATLVEAFRFVMGLRLRRQLDARSRRAPSGTKLALSELGAVERTRLREAFRAVERWHEHARHHYQTSA